MLKQVKTELTAKAPQVSFDAKKLYEKMLLLRRFEERAGQLYTKGEISGFCHLYIGQEAVAIGLMENLTTDDAIITSYRDHGIMLAMDSNPDTLMAELCGKYTGCSKGKGGSMHIFDTAKGFYGGHGIVGAQVPLGTGIAFAKKYQNSRGIAVAMMGDGAANQGQVYEAFNMASLWSLPVLYIIENNQYAMGTSVERSAAGGSLANRGAPFGIEGKQVDGMDVIAVMEAVKDAVKRIRDGAGPQLLEMMTYRYRGHSMSDPAKYRKREEVDDYRAKDPLTTLKDYIIKEKIADDEWFKITEKDVSERVMGSVKFALESAEPPAEELYRDIYVEDNYTK